MLSDTVRDIIYDYAIDVLAQHKLLPDDVCPSLFVGKDSEFDAVTTLTKVLGEPLLVEADDGRVYSWARGSHVVMCLQVRRVRAGRLAA